MNKTYPRLRIRRSHEASTKTPIKDYQASAPHWYVVLQFDKYVGDLIVTGLTWPQARRITMIIQRAGESLCRKR